MNKYFFYNLSKINISCDSYVNQYLKIKFHISNAKFLLFSSWGNGVPSSPKAGQNLLEFFRNYLNVERKYWERGAKQLQRKFYFALGNHRLGLHRCKDWVTRNSVKSVPVRPVGLYNISAVHSL